jgi:hypothetical protein
VQRRVDARGAGDGGGEGVAGGRTGGEAERYGVGSTSAHVLLESSAKSRDVKMPRAMDPGFRDYFTGQAAVVGRGACSYTRT